MVTIAFTLFLLSLLQVVTRMSTILTRGTLEDFAIYQRYAMLFFQGQNPYTQEVAFNYPPTSLLFFFLFPVTLPFSSIIFTVCSLVSLIMSVFLLSSLVKIPLWVRFVVVAVLFQMFPTKFTLGAGQVNLIVLLLLCCSFYCVEKSRNKLAGVFWAFACMIKVIPFPIGLYFLLKRRYETVCVGLLLFALSTVLILLWRPETAIYTVAVIPGLLSPLGKGASPYDQSLRAMVERLDLGNDTSITIAGTLMLLVFSGWKLIAQRKNQDHETHLAGFSLILAVTTVINSFAWQHHFVLLYPGLISQLALIVRRKHLVRGLALFLSIMLLGMHVPNPLSPPTSNPLLMSHTFLGALILITLLLIHPQTKRQKE